jgi:hypothetical protein
MLWIIFFFLFVYNLRLLFHPVPVFFARPESEGRVTDSAGTFLADRRAGGEAGIEANQVTNPQRHHIRGQTVAKRCIFARILHL